MPANPSHSLEQVEQFVTVEGGRPMRPSRWKYADGLRPQAHWDGSTHQIIHSRHLLDTTDQYLDVAEFLSEAMQPGVGIFIPCGD
jgi:hypothetical protein